ncbi:ABC transporter permease [Candidatus Dojkabacteria bacterium]|nr:ABC transporter permease [Candidatus Dojkabacteria bacterium]
MSELSVFWKLTKANILMYIRDRGAIFWSLFFPFMIIGIFGLLDFGNMGTMNIGLVYDDTTKMYAESLEDILKEDQNYKFHTGSKEHEMNELENDNRITVLEFTKKDNGQLEVKSYTGKQNENYGFIVTMVSEKILLEMSLAQQQIQNPVVTQQETVNTNNLRNIDYVVPGVIAMTLMQGSLFTVIGTIVGNREKGILKRIFATPLDKTTFLVSNVVSRTVIAMMQVAILLIVSWIVFKIKIVGSVPLVAILSILGCLVFLSMGFLVSGIAKTSEAARSMVMPFQMIMMFTGGVYFDRSVLPGWLYDITAYSPLTYLSDSLKDVMVKGYGLGDASVRTTLIALSIWLVVLIVISVRTFKWEDNGK